MQKLKESVGSIFFVYYIGTLLQKYVDATKPPSRPTKRRRLVRPTDYRAQWRPSQLLLKSSSASSLFLSNMSSEDPIASFLWSGDPSNSSGGAESTNGLSGSQSTGSLNAPRTVFVWEPYHLCIHRVLGLVNMKTHPPLALQPVLCFLRHVHMFMST
jgi:hypothetical protein